jgi:hypothetical protein
VFVAAGTCIEVIAYAVTTEPFNIIYYGNRNYYEAIIEQEKHFITYDSKEFRGSHTHNSQGFFSGMWYKPTEEGQDLWGPPEVSRRNSYDSEY